MVGGCAEQRGCAFDRVHTAQGALLGPAPGSEVMHVPHPAWRPGEDISIQAEHDIRGIKVVSSLHRLTKGELCPGQGVVAIDRFPAVPTRLWKCLEDLAHLGGQRGRGEPLAQKPQPLATAGAQLL